MYSKDLFCPDNVPYALNFDQACIIFENTMPRDATLTLFRSFDICYKCSDEFWIDILGNSSVSLLVPIYTKMAFQYFHIDYGISSCVVNYQFEQHGVYKYFMDFSCDSVIVIVPPDYPYTSLFISALIILVIWVLEMFLATKLVGKGRAYASEWIRNKLLKKLWRLPKERQSNEEIEDLKAEPGAEPLSHGKRKIEPLDHGERVEPLDQGERSSKIVATTSNEQVEVLDSEKGMNDASSLEGMGSESQAGTKNLEFAEFEALLAFRGLFAVLWILFTVEGGSYTFLRSSPWNGLGILDITTGWLYWALAASFYLHLDYALFRGKSRWKLFLRGVLLRSALYIAGGFVYNHINSTSPLNEKPIPLNKFRVFGIFQRVGMANFITSSVEVIFMKRNIKRGPYFQDVRDTWPQWVVAVALAMTHTGITLWLPVKGCPTGYTGPGGLSDKSLYKQCTGGAAAYIDSLIFHPSHLLPPHALEKARPPVYKTVHPFDPQGLLGTLTTCVLMTLAMQASRIFIYFRQPFGRIVRLLFWAICQLVLGGVLCNFRVEEGPLPPNRLLMSLSYVLLVSGMAYLTLLVFYLFINVWKLWSAFFYIYQGINLLVSLVGYKLFVHMFPFQLKFLELNKHWNVGFLLTALWNVVLWYIVCYYLLKMRVVLPV